MVYGLAGRRRWWGRILAGRIISQSNLGAYLSPVGPGPSTRNIPRNFPSVYRLPVIHARTYARFTNTTPIGAYRGAGRPEGVCFMERLIDEAARAMNIDRVELRRRNLIPADAMPYKTGLIFNYDSGEFEKNMDDAMGLADCEG